MFQFTGLAPRLARCQIALTGCPIRKSVLWRVFAPGHGLSQLVTSFFASESQGILHVPFSPFLFSLEFRLFTLLPSVLETVGSYVCVGIELRCCRLTAAALVLFVLIL